MTLRLAAIAALLVLAGCDASEPGTADGAPALIAPAAFTLDTEAFPDANARVGAGAHFVNAAARVGLVSTVVGLRLVLPKAATAAATRDQPTVADGEWVWQSTVDVFGTSVDLRLKATPDGSTVRWRLVSTADDGEPFTYYTATTSLDGQTGSWRLFSPDAAGAVLTADFDVRGAEGGEVTFAVPNGLENGGSSVRYVTDGDDLTFDWLDQPEADRALIEWDRATRAGSITADTYNGGARACWNAALEDVAC